MMNMSLLTIYMLLVFIIAMASRNAWSSFKTNEQRLEMLVRLSELRGDEHRNALSDMQKVPFWMHNQALYWGNDPYKLYTGAARNLIPRDKA